MKYILFTRYNCHACPTMKRNLEAAKIPFIECDVDDPVQAKAASKYYVYSLPTLIVKDGERIVEKLIGAQPMNVLMDLVRRYGR